MTSRSDIAWSFGGGTQSAAIACLISIGALPKPDVVVMADTGREASEVWRYLDRWVRPVLLDCGLEVNIAGHDLATVDLWGGKKKDTLLVPAFTKNGTGQLPRYCSAEWKTRVINRWLKTHGFNRGEMWIGFSTDEIERIKPNRKNNDPWRHVYPLIDQRLSRNDCMAILERERWPTPPRSACWCCPYRSNAEWRALKMTEEGDWRSAITLDANIRLRDSNAFLHRSGVPLAEANLNESQGDLFIPCDSGHCFT